jgi:hypothetical protein
VNVAADAQAEQEIAVDGRVEPVPDVAARRSPLLFEIEASGGSVS